MIGSTLLLYENEQGKIQSLIEDLWIKVDDLQKQALSRHVAFMHVITGRMTSAFDRIFGRRLFSVESIGVSVCYSFGFVGLIGLISLVRKHTADHSIFHHIYVAVFGFVYGTIPALVERLREHLERHKEQIVRVFSQSRPETDWRKIAERFLDRHRAAVPVEWISPRSPLITFYWACFLIFWILMSFVWPELRLEIRILLTPNSARAFLIPFVDLTIMGIALSLFTFFTILLRVSTQYISVSNSPVTISLFYLLNSVPLITFYGSLKLLGFWIDRAQVTVTSWDNLTFHDWAVGIIFLLLWAFVAGMSANLVFAVSAIISLALTIIMLLHRLFWPLLQRPIYTLQAIGIAKRRKLFAATGFALIIVAIGKYEWLGKILHLLPHG